MRLSEAIYLGSKLRPQTYGNYFDEHGSCAMGAAYEATGNLILRGRDGRPILHPKIAWSGLYAWSSVAYKRPRPCPVCQHCSTCLSMVIHLNDHHNWTRERIADWVATVEPKEEEDEGNRTHQTADSVRTHEITPRELVGV